MCKTVKLSDGSTIIACSRGDHRDRRVRTCVRCREPAAFLCDGPADPMLSLEKDEDRLGRCSLPLCAVHAFVGVDADAHYCWHHRLKKGATL
jgi:hypothetical protein